MWNPKNASWGCTEVTKELAVKLTELIPLQGSVENPRKNRHLEKFRKAQNVVYDVFNNGLCNRGSEINRVLGVKARDLNLPKYTYGNYHAGNWDQVEELVEEKFTPIVMNAAKEQGLV